MKDNPEFEFAAATVAAEEQEYFECEDAKHCPEVANALRRFYLSLIEACGGNANRIAVALYRVAGVSLRDTGTILKMSQEGVRKHIKQISKKNKCLGEMLGVKYQTQTVSIPDVDLHDYKKDLRERLKQYE